MAGSHLVAAASVTVSDAMCRARRQTDRMEKSKPALPEDDVLWSSANPRYGVVRRVLFCGDYAAQFDDLNGDFREVCLTIFERSARGWEAVHGQDDVDYPAREDDSAAWGFFAPYEVWAVGRARPHTRARIELYGGEWTVAVDADGWWLLVTDAPDGSLEADQDRWRSLMADAASGAAFPDVSAGAAGQVWPEVDAAGGYLDAARSPLRVTVD